MTLAAAQLEVTSLAVAQTGTTAATQPFAPLKQVNDGSLNVGYVDAGPADGPIVPYARGHGSTRFLSDATPRNGQPSVLARDIVQDRKSTKPLRRV